MATRKRGPIKIDLTGVDGIAKIDAAFCPIDGKYHVRIKGRRYCWTADRVCGACSEVARAAENTLYELIDDPPMSLIRVL